MAYGCLLGATLWSGSTLETPPSQLAGTHVHERRHHRVFQWEREFGSSCLSTGKRKEGGSIFSSQRMVTCMQWLQGDHTMLDMIEKKRCLCKEIKARQKSEKGLCKQDSMPILPSWKKNTGTKKYSPPPYSKQQTVFWDTAI